MKTKVKKEIRIMGIDDSPFDKFRKGDVLVIGTIYRGGQFIDGVVSTKVRADGNNSTKKLIEMVNKCKFKPQLQAIMLDGIALGGFNVVDVFKLHKKTGVPVIVVMRDYPDFEKIKKALAKAGKEEKIRLMERAGDIQKAGRIYIQVTGMELEKAKEVIKVTSTHSFIPEPVRAAHLIGAGIVKGESRGRV